MNNRYLDEDIQVQCVARYGVIFSASDASEYWDTVWSWLFMVRRDLLPEDEQGGEWPKSGSVGMAILNEIYNWQAEQMRTGGGD